MCNNVWKVSRQVVRDVRSSLVEAILGLQFVIGCLPVGRMGFFSCDSTPARWGCGCLARLSLPGNFTTFSPSEDLKADEAYQAWTFIISAKPPHCSGLPWQSSIETVGPEHQNIVKLLSTHVVGNSSLRYNQSPQNIVVDVSYTSSRKHWEELKPVVDFGMLDPRAPKQVEEAV